MSREAALAGYHTWHQSDDRRSEARRHCSWSFKAGGVCRGILGWWGEIKEVIRVPKHTSSLFGPRDMSRHPCTYCFFVTRFVDLHSIPGSHVAKCLVIQKITTPWL